jgi:hypothetical protein
MRPGSSGIKIHTGISSSPPAAHRGFRGWISLTQTGFIMNDVDWLGFKRQIAAIVASVIINECSTSTPVSAALRITEWIQREYDIKPKSG